ncbi:MAG: PadR family transcriptional regulator [Gemmatimonadales bacterium]|jgi:transcriptional regulator
MDLKLDLMRGTLDMLVLTTLVGGSRHGYDIVRAIQEGSHDALQVEEGSLYPALHRMERKGWIESEWGRSENNRRAKFYRLTKDGRKQLLAEISYFRRFTEAAELLLEGRLGTEEAS